MLTLDGGGYLLAISNVTTNRAADIAALQDIFVAVALLTITVGLVLPGMIGHAASDVAGAADRLATGTLADFSRAMQALGAGDLDAAQARVDLLPLTVHSRDEVGAMAHSFNTMQAEIARAAIALDGAREGLRAARDELARLLAAEQGARTTAEQALRVRDHFLTAASHDLRTPLSMIMGRLERVQVRLERGRGIEQSWLDTQVGTMVEAGERILATVEEITDAAQLQAGRELALRVEALDLGEVVRTVATMIAEATAWSGAPPMPGTNSGVLTGRGTEVARFLESGAAWSSRAPIHVDVPAGIIVEGDRARLERVVQNLLSNAVKYSPEGTPIDVSARVTQAVVTLTVQDRGVGIPAEELPHLFTHFYRASTAIGIAGTGLGLAGCKAIVEQHGGWIALQSSPGEGTTVTVTLPRTTSQVVEAADAAGSVALAS